MGRHAFADCFKQTKKNHALDVSALGKVAHYFQDGFVH